MNILVIQTAFAGDLILTTPMIAELHRLVPQAAIDVLCIPATAGLLENNPAFIDRLSVPVPDGDARLAVQDYSSFRFPDCPLCGGICKPDVIFFGEFIPKQRVSAALRAMDNADSLVIVGSSLMVLSGYRFCRTAREQGKPMVSINIGRSRADQEFSLKIEQDCCQILSALTERLDATRWCNQG